MDPEQPHPYQSLPDLAAPNTGNLQLTFIWPINSTAAPADACELLVGIVRLSTARWWDKALSPLTQIIRHLPIPNFDVILQNIVLKHKHCTFETTVNPKAILAITGKNKWPLLTDKILEPGRIQLINPFKIKIITGLLLYIMYWWI